MREKHLVSPCGVGHMIQLSSWGCPSLKELLLLAGLILNKPTVVKVG
jgi:hypothetical protein